MKTILKTMSGALCVAVVFLLCGFLLAGCNTNPAADNTATTTATGTNAVGQPTPHQSSMVNRARHKPGAAGNGQ